MRQEPIVELCFRVIEADVAWYSGWVDALARVVAGARSVARISSIGALPAR